MIDLIIYSTQPKCNAIGIKANSTHTITVKETPAAFMIGVYFLWFHPNV